MPPAMTLSSVVDADRSGEQLAFRVLADGIFDRIRRKWKEVVASLPKVLRQSGSGMITGSTINYIAAHFIRSVLDWRRSNRRLSALRTGWQCTCLHPADPLLQGAGLRADFTQPPTSSLRADSFGDGEMKRFLGRNGRFMRRLNFERCLFAERLRHERYSR
jgi:hypothetical protein